MGTGCGSAVLFGVDDRYVEPMLVTLVSLGQRGGLRRLTTDIRVLHSSLGQANQSRILEVGSRLGFDVQLVAVGQRLDGLPVSDWITEAAYLRLSLAEAASDHERIVYLDCDLVALGDISALFEMRLEATIAAVRDIPNPLFRCGTAVPGYERLGIAPDREYFNSGVLVIDVDRWRREDIAARCTRFLRERPEHVRFWDQDAVNVVLDDAWQRLPVEYNVVALSPLMPLVAKEYRGGDVLPLDDAIALEDRARILHYAGPMKPWWNSFPSGRLREHYTEHARALATLERPPV